MSVSSDYLRRCAAETGFSAATLERVVRLGELAGDVARHPLLGNALMLKGGTPLNLGFGPPQRLSVDLDYNYVAKADRVGMLAQRSQVEDAVARLAERHGYGVQRSADAFAGRKLHLRFISALGPPGLVQIDINYLHRLPLDDPAAMILWQPGDLDWPAIKAVGAKELLVGKFLAFLDRSSPRDVWDVANLPVGLSGLLGQRRTRQLFLALAATLEQPLPGYGRARLEASLAGRAVEEQLAPMLAGGERLGTGPLVEAAWEVVAPLLTLSAAETAYFTAVNEGELRLGLIFPDAPEEAARLAEHPALQWKVSNAQKRRRSR